MKILSHRGYWKTIEEKNSLVAFERSFELGFGTETDVRDHNGTLVISHDIPRGGEILFGDFLDIAASYSDSANPITLALNIKADGLSEKVAASLKNYQQLDCFVFDMSIPDMRSYFSENVAVFTRMSEVETIPVWLEKTSGIWLDSFDHDWFGVDELKVILESKKRVCIVSSELHQRTHLPLWSVLKACSQDDRLMLCTDFPEDAQRFFRKN